MIIGNGDLASVIPDKEDFIFFASGVSNSQCTDEAEYQREMKLLLEQPTDRHFVYFSSLGVFTGKSRYYTHKREMERLVKMNFPLYTIIRLGNISWGNNPNTLINYLKAHPDAELRDEYRCVCDKDEFLYWIKQIPRWSCEMSIVGERMRVKDIHKKYVKPFKRRSS